MTISAVSVGAAVTPTVIKTYVSHYTNRSAVRQKPTAHISYHEGLHLIRSFLDYASHHSVEDLQAFTAQWVPTPAWVRTENVNIPQEYITKAADSLITQLGSDGVEEIGGTNWWQWRRKNAELKAEWIEMRADFNARKQLDEKSKRVMMYVHGGAYFFGSVDEHRYQMQRHARKLKARVFAPRYRLAPQFPFPCGLLDCLAAYMYLLTIHDHTEIVFAGDSAGGGMVLSMLCLLRDQGLPLPAGAVLISPWVDLTHSFPSVALDNKYDYIPAHGFMHKPSISWPPPNDDEMDMIRRGAGKELLKGRNRLEKKEVEREAARGFAVRDASDESETKVEGGHDSLTVPAPKRRRASSSAPGPRRHLQIRMGDKIVELKDQIQMYTTNQLLSHPLVSPVLQPSLGGLPPLLIMTGGGEMLRDEQIYAAHKAAHPEQYPLGDEYRGRYDPDDKILNKYKPTPVQLQVWEDLCHVAPTLSFTRPAKFMYRSVAQFSAWALARAQNTSIDIVDDDDISIISSDSDKSHRRHSKANKGDSIGAVGKAGDPLPPFRHHMIRQRVDRHGAIFPLDEASTLPALQMAPSEVGVIKVGPVKKWMDAKMEWDTKYARIKRKVQKRRITDMVKKGAQPFEGEQPPPSALAGRRKDEEAMMSKPTKSYWLAVWSGWGSKHDQDTIKREEEVVSNEKAEEADKSVNGVTKHSDEAIPQSPSRSRRKSVSKSRSRSRSAAKRLTIVSDTGQVEGSGLDTPKLAVDTSDSAARAPDAERAVSAGTGVESATDTHLTPMFVPKYKAVAHLRGESKEISDVSSIRTGYSGIVPDNASTRAVFSAAGISKERSDSMSDELTGADFAHGRPTTADTASERSIAHRIDDHKGTTRGDDTPHSRRSVERLMSHQMDVDQGSIAGTDNSVKVGAGSLLPITDPLRSPSSMAVVQHEGVVDIVEGGVADPSVDAEAEEDEPTPTQERSRTDLTTTPKVGVAAEAVEEQEATQPERPKLYERTDTEFQTAMEHL